MLAACRRALSSRLHVLVANAIDVATRIARDARPDVIVIDTGSCAGATGLDVLSDLKVVAPFAHIIVWSAYLSTEMTVQAMRMGAGDVRTKPVEPSVLLRWIEDGHWPASLETTATLDRVQWEYVRRVVDDCNGNISEAARRLGVQRLTLRRHLERSRPRR